jgi:hypothetical protein
MGSGRAGWYAYDFIDNGGDRSADRILPEFQNIEVGTVFPALPGVTDVFTVVQYEPEHCLVLSWRSPSGRYLTTWAFVLERLQPNSAARRRETEHTETGEGFEMTAECGRPTPSNGPQYFDVLEGAFEDSGDFAVRNQFAGGADRMSEVAAVNLDSTRKHLAC